MRGYLTFIEKLSKTMNIIAGVALTFVMFITVADVVLRFCGMPIVGTFEVVGLAGAIAIGFGIPITSFSRGHIFVNFVVKKFPKKGQVVINIATRLATIAIFILVGYNLYLYSNDLLASGEVTLTRQLPFYPIGYSLSFCCFVQCLVMIGDIVKIFGGAYE
jgi:TRAP-type C4-dicarboxylate transport system permease small subunit